MSGDLFTLFGSAGFIGRRLAERLTAAGHVVANPGRDVFLPRSAWLDSVYLGHVVYCIGRTADFRGRPVETVEAHIDPLAAILRRGAFESLLYLSSTRVYAGLPGPAEENQAVAIDVSDADQLYNASKIAGEALCLAMDQASVRVARMSNVFGSGMRNETFLASLLEEAASGSITIRTAPGSRKDYAALDPVCDALALIALEGERRLYNVASGVGVDNETVASIFARETGCSVMFAPDAPEIRHPEISVNRLKTEFGDRLAPLFLPLDAHLPKLIRERLSEAGQAGGRAKEMS